MQPVFDVVLPVFAIILAGYLAGRLGLLGTASAEALNRFVFYFALPPLLFISTARVEADDLLRGQFIGAYLGGLLLTFVLAQTYDIYVQRASAAIVATTVLSMLTLSWLLVTF